MKDGNCMKNKNGGNENKIKFRAFNFIMDQMDRYGGKKTQRHYRYCSSYSYILENGLDDLWKGENPDSLEYTHYDKSFGKDPGQTGSILI